MVGDRRIDEHRSFEGGVEGGMRVEGREEVATHLYVVEIESIYSIYEPK